MSTPNSPDSPAVKALEAQQARLAEIINVPAKAIAERHRARLAEMMKPSLNMAMTSATSIVTKRMDEQRKSYADAVAPSFNWVGAKYSSGLPTLDMPTLADSMPTYEGLISDETMERIHGFQDHRLEIADIPFEIVQPASDASIREVVAVLERNAEIVAQQNAELRRLNDQQAAQLEEERAARAEDKMTADRRQKRSDLLTILGLVTAILGVVIAIIAIVIAVFTAG